MKHRQIILNPATKVLTVEGITYRQKSAVIGKDNHVKKIVFEEFDKEEYEDDITEIVAALEDKFDKKALLKDSLKDLETVTIKRILRNIKKKARIGVKHGCYCLTVGKDEIELRG